jgi:hypothetical protein
MLSSSCVLNGHIVMYHHLVVSKCISGCYHNDKSTKASPLTRLARTHARPYNTTDAMPSFLWKTLHDIIILWSWPRGPWLLLASGERLWAVGAEPREDAARPDAGHRRVHGPRGRPAAPPAVPTEYPSAPAVPLQYPRTTPAGDFREPLRHAMRRVLVRHRPVRPISSRAHAHTTPTSAHTPIRTRTHAHTTANKTHARTHTRTQPQLNTPTRTHPDARDDSRHWAARRAACAAVDVLTRFHIGAGTWAHPFPHLHQPGSPLATSAPGLAAKVRVAVRARQPAARLCAVRLGEYSEYPCEYSEYPCEYSESIRMAVRARQPAA